MEGGASVLSPLPPFARFHKVPQGAFWFVCVDDVRIQADTTAAGTLMAYSFKDNAACLGSEVCFFFSHAGLAHGPSLGFLLVIIASMEKEKPEAPVLATPDAKATVKAAASTGKAARTCLHCEKVFSSKTSNANYNKHVAKCGGRGSPSETNVAKAAPSPNPSASPPPTPQQAEVPELTSALLDSQGNVTAATAEWMAALGARSREVLRKVRPPSLFPLLTRFSAQ